MSAESPEPPVAPALSPAEPAEDLGFELPPPAKASRLGVLVVAGLVVGGGFTFGYLKYRSAHGAEPTIEASKTTRVEVIKPTVLSSDQALALPGTVRPLEEAKLYSRTTGYVRVWHADLGDKVTAGQVLAELDTPDLAAELSQARAQLAAARANVKQASAQRDYSKGNSARYVGLADQKLVSKQQVEETAAKAATDEAMVSATESTVSAMEANVRRLVELQSFAKILAPFNGTVSTRSIERGALVRDGSATTPLYTIVATDPVRIFVDVPQSVAPGVKVDMPAKVSVREYGGRAFEGKVTRSARSLDADLHTMMTEIQVPNPDGALMPGMYVQVALALSTPHRVLEVPATALYTDAKGVRLAVVEGGKIRFAKIVVERDTGATVHIGAGLTGDEQIVKIAIPTLDEGTVVETVK